MKKTAILLFIFLVSCTPQVTITPEATVTSPPPTTTHTPIPTPTLHPQFVALQEQIAASGRKFTLMPDGAILQQTENSAVTILGLTADKNGVMTLQVGDQQIEMNIADVLFDDENGVTIKGYQYNPEVGWIVEVVKEYPICTPESLRECEIPVEELFNGYYFRWLEEQAKNISCGTNMRTDINMENWNGWIIPDHNTTPNFRVKGTEFFVRDYTAGFTRFLLPDGQEVHYAVMPLFMCDLQDRMKVYPIITVASSYLPNNPKWNQEKANIILMNDFIPRWRSNSMKITVIMAGDTFSDAGRQGIQDPLVARTFIENPDMAERFELFIAGDFNALSKPGIVVLNLIVTNYAGMFK